MHPKEADAMANSVDPDQTASSEAVWSWSALFAETYLSQYIEFLTVNNVLRYNNNCKMIWLSVIEAALSNCQIVLFFWKWIMIQYPNIQFSYLNFQTLLSPEKTACVYVLRNDQEKLQKNIISKCRNSTPVAVAR